MVFIQNRESLWALHINASPEKIPAGWNGSWQEAGMGYKWKEKRKKRMEVMQKKSEWEISQERGKASL